MSTEWILIIVLAVAAIGVAVYFLFISPSMASADAPPTCAEIEAMLQAEVNKPNGGDVAKISELRNQINQNCRAPSVSQGPVTNQTTGEVFLPFSVESECSALVTSYMAEYKAIQTVQNDPAQKSAKASHMRVLLGDIRLCYQDKLTVVDETTINGLISSVEKALRDISSTKTCFKSGGLCQDDAWVVHGDNFIRQDLDPTIEALKEVKAFAVQRKADLIRALSPARAA